MIPTPPNLYASLAGSSRAPARVVRTVSSRAPKMALDGAFARAQSPAGWVQCAKKTATVGMVFGARSRLVSRSPTKFRARDCRVNVRPGFSAGTMAGALTPTWSELRGDARRASSVCSDWSAWIGWACFVVARIPRRADHVKSSGIQLLLVSRLISILVFPGVTVI